MKDKSDYSFDNYYCCLRDKAFKPEMAQRSWNNSTDNDCDYFWVIDPFILDIGKIKDSKAFRRLFFKTQVFPFPESAYVRNRGFHTEDVVSVATKIASICGNVKPVVNSYSPTFSLLVMRC